MKKNRFAAALLALIMVLSMAVPAWADGEVTAVSEAPLIYITSYSYNFHSFDVDQNEIFKLTLNFSSNVAGDISNIEVKYLYLEDTNFTIMQRNSQQGAHNNTYSAFTPIESYVVNEPITADGENWSRELFVRVSPSAAAGTLPLTFTAVVSYETTDKDGNVMAVRTLITLTSININVRAPEEEESSSSSESTVDPILTPHLIITGFSTAGASLGDNENFGFSVSFKNTSKDVAIENVVITITLPEGVSMPFASTNFYIDRVGPGKEETLAFTLKGKKNIEEGVATLGMAFNYQYYFDNAYVSSSDTENIGLAFGADADEEKEDRFEISNIATPDILYPNEEGYLTITVINKGKEQIMNVQAKIESDALTNSGVSEYYGLLDVNKKDEIELPMVASAGGNVMGTVTITYELSDGTEKTIVKDFTAYCEEVSEPVYDPSWDEPIVEPEQAGMPWWGWLAIAGGGAAALITLIVVLKKRAAKKKQAAIDAEDSADDE